MLFGEVKRRVSLRVFSVLLVSALWLCTASFSAWGQSSNVGTVSGQVTDESNAAVPGASVKITNTATSESQSAISNAEGRYIFAAVPAGSYNVSFSKDGFNSYNVNAQAVQISRSLTINAKLKVGSTATTVEVTAAAGAELQTMNATVGGTITGQEILLLPNMGRDATSMSVLQPGATTSGFFAGSYQDANTYILDGANITDDMGGNTIGYETNYSGLGGSQGGGIPTGVIPTPIESIEEFKVNVANQGSDFNNSSGAQIVMQTKRGANQFHGSGYMYYYDTKLGSANSWSNNHTPYTYPGTTTTLPYTPITSNHRDHFGASLGGPLLPKNFLGKKWYFFVNYEGLRFPNVGLQNKNVPSALWRAGVIQVKNSSNVYVAYNLNPNAVTVNGVTYQPAICPAGSCDPLGKGLNPIVNDIWSKQMPIGNNPLGGDTYNTIGYLTPGRTPLTSNNYVSRIDHDFNDKNHWYLTYKDFKLVSLTANQADFGGVLPGCTFGQFCPTAPRPQQPSDWATGLSTNITPTVTNTFVFSYLRNFWQWSDDNGPAQGFGLGGALEIGGESSGAYIPYNVNTQSVRQRFWDGQDKGIKDDLTMIKGNHLFSFGGSYTRNFDYHSRTDNGNGVNNQISYLSTSSGFVWASSAAAPGIANPYIPATVPSSQYSTYETLYAETLGMLSSTQVMYTRSGSQLSLQPIGTPATDKDIIPSYTTYFSDTWHVKPSLTLIYGLGWNLEMPPYELNGNQVELITSGGQPIVATDYLAARQNAALQGQVYLPQIGYELVRNVGAGLKYPYDPYYGEFSPRFAAAWNPHFQDGLLGKIFGNGKTVIRGGYGRIFGRLNGVDLVLVPLLGPGLLQGVTCANPLANGTCAGANVADPTTAFRIGINGTSAPLATASATLPQPFFPGTGTYPETVDPDALDPHFKPDRTDNFTLTIQREINQHMTLEVGYIGKILRNEYMLMDLDAVPYMTTLNGQSFAQAYSQVYQQIVFNGVAPGSVTAQPFFESALGGAGSAYCKGFASCTAALASNQTTLFKDTAVSDIWSAMNKAPSWTLGRTMNYQAYPGATAAGQSTSINTNTSLGWGNYNALFARFQTNNWHGLTTVSNFTWGRALGTGQLAQYNSATTPQTPFDIGSNYGPQNYDIKFIYNLSMYYQPPVFKGQHGILGHLLGGWTFSPLFTAQSGGGASASYSEGSGSGSQEFGEVSTGAAVSSTGGASAAVGYLPVQGISVHYNDPGTSSTFCNIYGGCANGVGNQNNSQGYLYGLQAFNNPGLAYSAFRPCVLGFDTSCGGYFNLRGFPVWNLDMNVIKDFGIVKERVGAQFFVLFTNIFNHLEPGTPSMSLTSPGTFGQFSMGGTPRQMELGLRLHF